MTIHWLLFDTKRIMSSGRHATRTAHASSTTFFQNVCQLVNTSASPKHPQSLTGSATASHSVSGVITSITSNTSRDTSRRRMANIRQMPNTNSTADNSTDAPSVTKSGSVLPNPIAVR